MHKHSLPLLLTSFNFARVFLLFALEDAWEYSSLCFSLWGHSRCRIFWLTGAHRYVDCWQAVGSVWWRGGGNSSLTNCWLGYWAWHWDKKTVILKNNVLTTMTALLSMNCTFVMPYTSTIFSSKIDKKDKGFYKMKRYWTVIQCI